MPWSIDPELAGALIQFPKQNDVVYLDDGNAHAYSIAATTTKAFIVAVDADGNVVPVWGSITGTAAEPTDDVTDGTAAFPIVGPCMFHLPGGGTLSLIRAVATNTFVVINRLSI